MSRRLNRESCTDVLQAKSGKLPLHKLGASWHIDQLRIDSASSAPLGQLMMVNDLRRHTF